MFAFIHFTEIIQLFFAYFHFKISNQCYIFVGGTENVISITQKNRKLFSFKNGGLYKPMKRIIILSKNISSKVRILKFA